MSRLRPRSTNGHDGSIVCVAFNLVGGGELLSHRDDSICTLAAQPGAGAGSPSRRRSASKSSRQATKGNNMVEVKQLEVFSEDSNFGIFRMPGSPALGC